jgi:glycine reductase
MKAVHYLNQFFAGMGGEEQAETPPTRLDGAVGPGRGLAAALEGVEIVATLACGDDYFAEHEDQALEALLEMLAEIEPDVLVAGPAFGSGRYGYACARLAAAAAERGIAAVAAMHEENPGVSEAGAAYVVPTAVNVAGMRDALPRLGALASALASGGEIGSAEDEGYLARGFRRNYVAEKTGAERAVELLLAKLEGETRTEVAGDMDRVEPPPPVADLSSALVALVTEAGCVPQGNPDHLRWGQGRFATTSRRRHASGAESVRQVHAYAGERSNRLVARRRCGLERAGRVGRVHESLYGDGNGTPVVATRFGQEIAGQLRDAGVQAVLLSGT